MSAIDNTTMTRGVHHLALTTDDMKATTEFYVDIIGMPLVHAMKVPAGLGTGPNNRGNPPYEAIRHYFFYMGNDSLLAFFEIPKGEEPAANRNAIGGMQHVAFVVTEKRFFEIEQRLKDKSIEYNGPTPQLPGLIGIYFYDPNGIRMEMACQLADGENPDVMTCNTQTRAVARAELETLTDDQTWIDDMLRTLDD
jgi:catechol 2,3-dioxygenase-like lactoylglutathione lyase family enzyme